MKPTVAIVSTLALVMLAPGVGIAQKSAVSAADVAIIQNGGHSTTVGANASFTLTPRNAGTVPLGSDVVVTVKDVLPSTFTQVTASGSGWSCAPAGTGPMVSCSRNGPLAAGQPFPPISVSAKANAPGNYQNCAQISYGFGPAPSHSVAAEQNMGNNSSCFAFSVQQGGQNAQAADLAISLNGNPTLSVGSPANFTLSPRNAGTVPLAASVTVTDTLPPSFSQIAASGPGWNCSSANGYSVSCTRPGPIAASAALPPINVSAKANSPGNYQNCAQISFNPTSSTAADAVPGNNSSCFSFAVQPGGPQAPACLMTNNVARFITGTAQRSAENDAQNAAQSDWSQKASSAGGPAYGSWNKATQKNVSCSTSGDGVFVQKSTRCTYGAQPCQ